MILEKTDFESGEFSVAQNKYDDLMTFIYKYEHRILLDLFGKNMYEDFKNDLTTGTPQTPQTVPYENVFNEIFENGIESEGIKEMLKKFIYYYFVVNQHKTKTVNGIKESKSELAENNTTFSFTALIEAYNSAVSDYKNIQTYIFRNMASVQQYTNFKGKTYKYIIF